jgi:hypothetical protein
MNIAPQENQGVEENQVEVQIVIVMMITTEEEIGVPEEVGVEIGK